MNFEFRFRKILNLDYYLSSAYVYHPSLRLHIALQAHSKPCLSVGPSRK